MRMNRPQLVPTAIFRFVSRIPWRDTEKAVLVGLSLILASGCSLHKANKAMEEQHYEEAAKAYLEIAKNNPSNIKARMGYRRAAPLAAKQKMDKAKEFQHKGQEEQALLEVQKALMLDPSNSMALDWLAAVEEQRASLMGKGEDLEAMKAEIEAQDALQLNPRSIEGVNLNFATRQSLREIMRQLSLASGVNILFHTSYQDVQVSLDLRGLTFQRILDTLMLQNDLFFKVMDSNSIMIFKSNPQNREQYENQLVKTFYLSYAEVDGVRSVLTTLSPQLKVFTDKRLNAVVVKAKPNELAIAKRIVNQLDKPKAEVMVYLELLEVTESSLEQVGLLPTLLTATGDAGGIYRIGATLNDAAVPNQNKGGVRIKKSDIRFLFPNLALDALKSNGDAKLVASPNVRVVSGEAGEVNIGEKITTTQSAISGIGGAAGGAAGGALSGLGGAAQTQFGYEDVGVKIKVEPRVHINGDITLKIDSKVTTKTSETTPGRPNIGQREIKTSTRLRDGETVVFGGLLKEEEQKSLQGIWGLTDIPFLGKLLGNQRNAKAKTDVLLTIRTVLVRKPSFSPDDLTEFDPDLATSRSGLFGPKSRQKPKSEGNASTAMATPPNAKPAPLVITPDAQVKPSETPNAPPFSPTPVPESPEVQAAPSEAPQESELVFFMSPMTDEIRLGERARISVLVSGGKGVTSGTLDLRIDPNLKLVGFNPGDFLTADGGTADKTIGNDGVGKLNFKRTGKASDSGTLVILELEGVGTANKGNSPVMIQGGSFKSGSNPISGRFVNALVTVSN